MILKIVVFKNCSGVFNAIIGILSLQVAAYTVNYLLREERRV